jgi:hypothetical protein
MSSISARELRSRYGSSARRPVTSRVAVTLPTHPVHIASVQPKSGWWLITDAEGLKYSTKSSLYASLADRARVLSAAVRIDAGNGWNYRELWHIELLNEVA